LGKGKPAQQHRIYDAEDGGVRSDAECERKHGHRSEAGILQQLAEGEFEVVHGSLNRDSLNRSTGLTLQRFNVFNGLTV
jgi:hypothetical protein